MLFTILLTVAVLCMNLHIGKLVAKIVKEKGIKPSVLAMQINTSKQNLNSIFKRETIDTGILLALSKTLHYNFFVHYCEGDLLTPSAKQEIALLKQELKKINTKLELANKELGYLQKINELLERKK